MLDQIASKFPDTPFLAEAIYERGFAKQNLKQLDAALKDSEYLIVFCSPQAAASPHVNEEVRLFKTMGGADKVIQVIV